MVVRGRRGRPSSDERSAGVGPGPCRCCTAVLYGTLEVMAELNSAKTGVRVKIEIWVDHGKIVFSNVDQDFGPKGLIGSFVPGSAAERQARELLVRHGVLPAPGTP